MRKSKWQQTTILVVIGFLILVFSVVIGMSVKNTADMRGILEESVKAQLISISVAARGIIDADKFDGYNSEADTAADAEAYGQTLALLRQLQTESKAKYIYALKQLNGQYYFVFDTDQEDEGIFEPYALSPVHEQAFVGKENAGLQNVSDAYGTFNTGAVPIWKDGKVIGVVSTDIEDAYLQRSANTARANAILLIATMVATMAVMLTVLLVLLRRVRTAQEKLHHMANYDAITGLPNRQYLLEYLGQISAQAKKVNAPFALLFVDLDNFKKVNDGAGHDAGDELLRHIALYLSTVHENSKAFRPAPGILNISARIGGDEFVQIIPGVGTEAEGAIAAQKLLDGFRSQALSRFIDKYQVGLSIGVALFPYHSNDYNVLIKYADIAMYHAKRGGKNSYRVYVDEMGQEGNE